MMIMMLMTMLMRMMMMLLMMMMMMMVMMMTLVTRWGIWREDPGPRGVHITDWSLLEMMGGLAPSGWTFDSEVVMTLVIMMIMIMMMTSGLVAGGTRPHHG